MCNLNIKEKAVDELRQWFNSVETKNIENPANWLLNFNANSLDERIETLKTYWQQTDILPYTSSYIFSHLAECMQVTVNGKLAIVYCIQTSDDEIVNYIGYAPETVDWLTPKLNNFYSNIHAGLTDCLGFMGLLPLDEVLPYDGREDWQLQLKRTDNVYELFHSGGGGYLLLNVKTDTGLQLFVQDEFDEDDILDFYKELDEWIIANLDEG